MVGGNKVHWLSLPRSSGSFQAHLQQVENSLKARLARENHVEFCSWPPEGGGDSGPLLLLFQSQGRPGDEFPGVLPPDLRRPGSAWQVVVVVVQDDEATSVQSSIVPEGVPLRGLVSVHVVPGQHELHRCQRNQDALQTIAALLGIGKKAGWKWMFQTMVNFVRYVLSLLASERAPTVYLLLLPQSSGAFHSHMQSLDESVRARLGAAHRVRLLPWTPRDVQPDSPVLILFRSQGRPGDELPSALPAQLTGGQQNVLVAVVQDDEVTSSSANIVPRGVRLLGVVSLHVVPGQQQLHECHRNGEAVTSLARLLRLPPRRSPALWPLLLAAAGLTLALVYCRPPWLQALCHWVQALVAPSFWKCREAGVAQGNS